MEEEEKKQVDSNLSSSFPSSSSSLADDIFGPKPTPSGTAFGSIFPPPSQPKSVEFDKNRNKEHHNPQEQSPQPCHLSSSIYYGGRDVYSDSNDHNKDATGKSATIKKDGGEDDTGSASRGNWWQGSLYY